MEASELRIGNWILPKMKEYKSEWKAVSLRPDIPIQPVPIQVFPHLITRMVFNEDTLEMYEPIPLTEEWLNKSDLKKRGTRDIWDKGNFVIHYQRHNDAYSQLCQGKFYFSTIEVTKNFALTFYEIKHLHQLQNLYFALVGEELTFKSE